MKDGETRDALDIVVVRDDQADAQDVLNMTEQYSELIVDDAEIIHKKTSQPNNSLEVLKVLAMFASLTGALLYNLIQIQHMVGQDDSSNQNKQIVVEGIRKR